MKQHVAFFKTVLLSAHVFLTGKEIHVVLLAAVDVVTCDLMACNNYGFSSPVKNLFKSEKLLSFC